MASLKESYLAKVVSFLSKSDKKYLSFDDLCRGVGIYQDALGPELSYFEPMILMDSSLNMRSLLEPIQAYLASAQENKNEAGTPKRVVATSKELSIYPNIASFVYQKMTSAGGLVDPSAKLSDHDLHVLQKLVAREVNVRKKNKRHSAKRK